MPHFYLRLVVMPVVLFTAALLLIHAQPYDDHELRELLLPEGCPAPCFMGIRPGVTTVDETIQLLEASGWMEQYELSSDGKQMSIRWNNNSPSWFDKDDNDTNNGSRIWFVDGLVDGIRIDTNLTIGDVQLILGNPLLQNIEADNIEGQYYLGNLAVYPNVSLLTLIFIYCDTKGDHITHQTNVILNYQKLTITPEFQRFFQASWSDVLRARCP